VKRFKEKREKEHTKRRSTYVTKD